MGIEKFYKDNSIILSQVSLNVKNELTRLLKKLIELKYIKEVNTSNVKLELNFFNSLWITVHGIRKKNLHLTILENVEKTEAKTICRFFGRPKEV